MAYIIGLLVSFLAFIVSVWHGGMNSGGNSSYWYAIAFLVIFLTGVIATLGALIIQAIDRNTDAIKSVKKSLETGGKLDGGN